MPVTVICGGQFGSEGKGKVAYEIAKRKEATIAVRVGGTGSGHTVIDSSNRQFIFRLLPTASLLPNVTCILPTGSYIDIPALLTEIELVQLAPDRLIIDPNAFIILEEDKEKELNLKDSIGSTGSGTGAAVQRRISRARNIRFAKDEPVLQRYIFSANEVMRKADKQGERIIIEGTQGFGLSLLHSDHYPFVTSRDTTAAAFVAEAGLSPLDVDEIVLTIRAFPIRVGGNSGKLENEISWKMVTQESGAEDDIIEYTSVTKKVRRVARFDPEIVKRAISVNRPSCIVMNHLDYIDHSCQQDNSLSEKTLSFIRGVEQSIEMPISYYGIGLGTLIEKREMRNVPGGQEQNVKASKSKGW